MSKLRFTAEDFKRCATKERHDLRQFIADEANARLEEMLREKALGELRVFGLSLEQVRKLRDFYLRHHVGLPIDAELIDGK